MITAREENVRTLQGLLGLDRTKSEKVLDSYILISSNVDPSLANALKEVLSRTFYNVHLLEAEGIDYDCHVSFVGSDTRHGNNQVWISQNDAGEVMISSLKQEQRLSPNLHPVIHYLIACYTSALVCSTLGMRVTSSKSIRFDPFEWRIEDLIGRCINIGESYLAGAGAIGNAFIKALSLFDVTGKVHICDSDLVSDGNLNRCFYFEEIDIGENKAETLVRKTNSLFPTLSLDPVPYRLQTHCEKEEQKSIPKLIVAVDSRRARRELLHELPHEVFDASTTGIEEIVLHYSKQPTGDLACMGCIYPKDETELTHENHVAETLGVAVSKVQMHYVDIEAAEAIAKKYNDLNANDLLGQAYDTLFKQLCSEGQLRTEEDKQVLAPLAFVSILAGIHLTILFLKSTHVTPEYNYWRLSPWSSPNMKLKQNALTNPNCEFCTDPLTKETLNKIWL